MAIRWALTFQTSAIARDNPKTLPIHPQPQRSPSFVIIGSWRRSLVDVASLRQILWSRLDNNETTRVWTKRRDTSANFFRVQVGTQVFSRPYSEKSREKLIFLVVTTLLKDFFPSKNDRFWVIVSKISDVFEQMP